MRCVGLTSRRVTELWMPPRRPVASDLGTSIVRSCAWYTYTTPSGIRCDTIARATSTPLELTHSTQSLSEIPAAVASCGLIQTVGPPRESRSEEHTSELQSR